jgi:hypothetical protein
MNRIQPVLACLALLGAAGCSSGSKKVVVKGQIVLDGANLAVAENEAVLMSLIPPNSQPRLTPYSGSVNRDGTFVVAGPSDGSGVLPGKYKVSLQTLLTDRERSTDRFGGRYVADKTTLDIEVVPGMGPVTLALTTGK